MDEKLYKTLSELIEHATHTSDLLIGGEIALNDGEIELSQKNNVEAQNMLHTMIKDIFEETKQELSLDCDKVNDYDLPTTLELARQLVKVANNAASYITVVLDAQNTVIKGIVANKLQTSINTVVEIYNAIFNN